MKRINRIATLMMLVALSMSSWADDAQGVHVVQRTLAGGIETILADGIFKTGEDYTTLPAPKLVGYIFTHWSIAQSQGIGNRDRYKRAREVATYHLFEATTVTANYLPEDEDADGDGMADGLEIYWYGTTDIGPNSDTDGDGYTFVEELDAGTNPHLVEDLSFGCIAWNDSEEVIYNPEGLAPYTIRSNPEGELFWTVEDYACKGATVVTPSPGEMAPSFALWTLNGVEQRDRLGRALDQVRVVCDGTPLELVAESIADEQLRAMSYWYGRGANVSPQDDTDGDGYDLLEEMSGGTNPLMAEELSPGGVFANDGEVVLYNPENLSPYVIRSEPENELFWTIEDYARPGESLEVPFVSKDTSSFAFWELNGVRQADRLGRAIDVVKVLMPTESVELVAISIDDRISRELAYWYGPDSDATVESDTDCDGYSFIEEIESGTNPILAETDTFGAISWDDGAEVEVNLQTYERVQGVVVDGKFINLFADKSNDDAEIFGEGAEVCPIVADLNGDGLFDIVVETVADESKVVFLNCGSRGNPEFKTVDWQPGWEVLVESSRLRSVDGMPLDVEPLAALSYSMAGDDLLVSDVDGRIWFYLWNGTGYELQHKVWGGTYAGFAKGLRIAAVDWEDDGDWDCLCGTADGKLMLLRDPKIGRPTNLLAKPGVDNVLLEWDPNQQSRVRGYKVYRNATESGGDGDVIGEPNLPRYRDWPPAIRDYEYRVSAFGRFYTAGNSEPEIVESPLTDPVRVELGKVSLSWNNATAFAGDEVGVSLSIENSLSLSGSGLVLKVEYNSKVLTPVRIQKSGLTEGIVLNDTVADGQWSICSAGGEMAAGGGTMLTLVFETSDFVVGTNTTSVGLSFASLKTVSGADISIAMPLSEADVVIVPSQNPSGDPTVVPPYSRGDVNGDGRLTKDDLQLMATLMKGGPNEKWNSNQLDAGDYNDDDSLDQDDYKLMRADFRAKGIVNGGEKMGVL